MPSEGEGPGLKWGRIQSEGKTVVNPLAKVAYLRPREPVLIRID